MSLKLLLDSTVQRDNGIEAISVGIINIQKEDKQKWITDISIPRNISVVEKEQGVIKI